jgi:hypothetical protein
MVATERMPLTTAWLTPATLIYLGLPVTLFIGGWMRPWIAGVLFAAAGAAVALHVLRRSPTEPGPSDRSLAIWTFGAVILVALCWVAVSGVGGFGTQSWDSQFHQSVLRDLTIKPWPVAYEAEGRTIAMVYSLQSYLPAALVGAAWGWQAANIAWAAWVAVGLCLVLLWYVKVADRGIVVPLLIFALWSGLDAVGLAMHSTFSPHHGPDFNNPEWWARYFQYSANATLLFYVPHYAIPSWLTALALLDDTLDLSQARHYILLMALAFYWSPFAFLGAGPLAVVVLLRTRARTLLRPLNVLGVVLFTVAFIYYMAKITGTELPGTRMPTGLSWAAVEPHHSPRQVVHALFLHPAFVLLEFGILALVVAAIGRRSGGGWYRGHFRWCFVASCIFLAALPALRMGEFNDIVMRASIGGLLVVMIGALRAVTDPTTRWTSRALVAALLMGGLLVPYQEWKRHRPNPRNLEHHVHIRPLADVPDMNGLFVVVHTQGFYDQFMGATDTLFFEHVAQPLDPVSEGDLRP